MSQRQVIISVSREFGSGGHEIAELLAQEFGLKMYDKSILDEIAKEMNMDSEELKKYDEKPRNKFLTRHIGDYTNSMEDILARKQFDFIREKAESGESFVIVGRCADTVLRDTEGLITIFVTGKKEYKTERVMKRDSLTREEAQSKMQRIDMLRRQYHNRYSDHKWGDSRYYDICIDGTFLGSEGTADMLAQYIRGRMEASGEKTEKRK